MRIGIVAGEASGDILGADLLNAFNKLGIDIQVEGIAGPLMQEQGAKSMYPMDRLSVMGISLEVLARYRELSAMRESLATYFIQNPPDVFIGIDAPDFNLGLESKLHQHGIKTVHYVSPSVWAWRQYRIRKIFRSVDLMLTLFPFEAAYYEEHNIRSAFVGHPLADRLDLEVNSQAYREQLNIASNAKLIAILPGSRASEIRYLADDFLEAAMMLYRKDSSLRFIAPMANAQRRQQFEAALARLHAQHTSGEALPIDVIDGHSREAMGAADAVMLASGTAALEAMLLKKPMVVAYRMGKFSYWLIKRLVSVSHYCLPNLLAQKELVTELIQDDLKPETIAELIWNYLVSPELVANLKNEFLAIHKTLRKNASHHAAEEVLKLVGKSETRRN